MNYWAFEYLIGGQNPRGKKKAEKEGKRNQTTSIEIKLIKFIAFIYFTIVENVFLEVFCYVLF